MNIQAAIAQVVAGQSLSRADMETGYAHCHAGGSD